MSALSDKIEQHVREINDLKERCYCMQGELCGPCGLREERYGKLSEALIPVGLAVAKRPWLVVYDDESGRWCTACDSDGEPFGTPISHQTTCEYAALDAALDKVEKEL